VDTCERAIGILKEKVPFGEDFFYPVLYLNLGRANLAAGRKKKALDAFNKGLTMDNENREILMELRRLGIRRKTAVPILERSNPINKYIGIVLKTALSSLFCKFSSGLYPQWFSSTYAAILWILEALILVRIAFTSCVMLTPFHLSSLSCQ
jgi:hypothetical protein